MSTVGLTSPSSGTLILRPSRGFVNLGLGEVWAYRELLFFLVWRDVKVRYKQTVLGGTWAVLQPLTTMAVFSIVFGHLAKMPSDGIPYPVFTFAALLPWQLFANALGESSQSLVSSQHLITKVYFPRLVIPLSAVLGGLVDFAIAFVVLIAMMWYYAVQPTAAVVLLPVFVLLAVASALAVGLWLSSLNVKYRDVRYVIPFLVQVWLFVTPVAYSSSLIPERWRALYALNPMTGVVEGFRWALFGTMNPPWALVVASTLSVAVLFTGGLFYFRRTEKTFADVV